LQNSISPSSTIAGGTGGPSFCNPLGRDHANSSRGAIAPFHSPAAPRRIIYGSRPTGRAPSSISASVEGNLREASPGLLDRFTPLPEARVVGAAGAQPLKLDKSPGAFVLSGTIGTGRQHRRRAGAGDRAQAGRQADSHPGPAGGAYVPDFAERLLRC
jgi:hypothetical protein